MEVDCGEAHARAEVAEAERGGSEDVGGKVGLCGFVEPGAAEAGCAFGSGYRLFTL